MVTTLCFQYRGQKFDPWLGNSHRHGEIKKKKTVHLEKHANFFKISLVLLKHHCVNEFSAFKD